MDAKASGLDAVAAKALEEVRDGLVVGLGSGRAATAFVRALGAKVKQGLRIRGVPTSLATARFADELGIPLTTLAEVGSIDIDFDGADEVAPNFDLIKGLGGALVREKIVARASKRVVILVTPEKLVKALGSRGILPIEVELDREDEAIEALIALGMRPEVRQAVGGLFLSDNGNPIVDCRVPIIADPAALDRAILAAPGVVGTGLFLGIADEVLVLEGDSVRVLSRP